MILKWNDGLAGNCERAIDRLDFFGGVVKVQKVKVFSESNFVLIKLKYFVVCGSRLISASPICGKLIIIYGLNRGLNPFLSVEVFNLLKPPKQTYNNFSESCFNFKNLMGWPGATRVSQSKMLKATLATRLLQYPL